MQFIKNIDWYFQNWKDNFSDYVDDLMQIAANELENKGMDALCEKLQDMIESMRTGKE